MEILVLFLGLNLCAGMIYGWAAAPLDFPFAKNIVQTERNTRPDHHTVKYCRSYADIREKPHIILFFVSAFLMYQRIIW